MTDWTSIAGGRCQGQPWRVGIVGFSLEKQQVFLLEDADWSDLVSKLPLEPLSLYGKGNGLLFDRLIDADNTELDAVLLIVHTWQGQPLFRPVAELRQYLLMGSAAERTSVADERVFAKLLVTAELPPFDERLVYVSDPVDFRLKTELLPQAGADHMESYPNSTDFWIHWVTTAVAADAVAVRGTAPLLSVIIPAYNYGRYLAQCVQSVLDQGFTDIEILVLDNASTDETPDVMAAFRGEPRIRYMRNRYNYGAGHNWINGLRISTGRYFTFLSADDYFNPGHLSRLLPVMENHPHVAVGYTSIRWVDEQDRALKQPRHRGYRNADYVGGRNEVADLLVNDCYMTPSAVIHRSEAFRKTWHAMRTNGAGDWDMVVQMAEQYPDFAYVDTPGVSYRWHGKQDSTRFYASTAPLEDHLTIVEGVLERDAQQLRGREREVAAHVERRLALFPDELGSPLGRRAKSLIERLDALAELNEAPLFSIVVITYNRPQLLKDALNSIDSQSLRDFDVVLVNDCGEPVEALLGDYPFPIMYLRQGYNQGPAAARNAAHRLARGRYLVYLDDDDLFLPEHLQTLADALDEHPGEVVYSDALIVVEKITDESRTVISEERRYPHDLYSYERLLVDNYIPINTFAWPRALVAEIGGFDERLSGLEDWDFLLRLAARSMFHHVRHETVQVRMRVDNDERRSQVAFKNYPTLYRDIYSRHPNGDVQGARAAKLKQMGGTFTPATKSVVDDWIAARTFIPAQKQLVEAYLQQREYGPSFTVVVLDLHGERDKLSRTLQSLRRLEGIAERVEPVVLTSTSSAIEGISDQAVVVTADDWIASLNQVLRDSRSDWLTIAQAGDEFTANGLMMVSLKLMDIDNCRAAYCDEVYRQADGRVGVALRPAFNLDYMLSFPAGMARHWLFRREVLVEAGGFDVDFKEALEFEAILRLINIDGLAGLTHIAEPSLITDAPSLADVEDERRAIIKHLQGRGYEQAQVASAKPGRYQVNYGHPEQPFVSVLIRAGDQLAHLQRCVESLLETTQYPHYELLLIESDPSASDVHEWLKALEGMGEARMRTIWPGSAHAGQATAFNLAAPQALGDYLLLLSPHTAIINADWLDELVNHAQRPEVGSVSGKLLTADGKVQHAGLTLGLKGPVGRHFLGESLDAPGYMQRLQVDQNYSALGGECLMVRKELFLEAGGLDTEPLLARWADADFCLKLQQAGYLNVWTPRVQLLVESPRTLPASHEQEDAMYARWLPVLAHDSAYNPGLSLQAEQGFKLADAQLAWRPLQAWRPIPTVMAHPADLYGCGNYRVIQPFAAMKQEGLVDGALSVGLLHVTDLERYDPDVILLQRQIGGARLEAMRRMKAFSRAFTVYELDDYLPNLPVKNVHRQHMPKDILKSLRHGLGLVDRFVVSTQPLAEAFAGLHDDIRVVENRLPVQWWGGLQGKRRTSKRPRVGWAGGSSHTGDLEMIADVVKELAGEVDWVFFGMCPEKLRPYMKEVHKGVDINLYPQALANLNLDLALAPVEQNLFNECKSNLRLLEYGACGFPVICSDILCYQGDLPVTRVKNRFRDWVEAIRMHLSDLDSTAAAGDALRDVVLRDWMLEGDNLKAWRDIWLPDSR
ncbi:glycosyltransferase [Pseudomonas sp. PDM14]|uniref:glycosyltransferase n=1 Tax=Pseudomonas sp. PDM14 TaxID=2769288 RepID=UPI00177C6230|nr:glycosyltransferase [Pseudomonas sp. PDM14]MBD9484366.1 glycosyltransferase [Pseudomonas sp. PDM14]